MKTIMDKMQDLRDGFDEMAIERESKADRDNEDYDLDMEAYKAEQEALFYEALEKQNPS